VNCPSFIWNPLVESCGSLTLPQLDFYLERNLSNVICFCLFLKIFLKCSITLSLNRLILLFTTAILGCHFCIRLCVLDQFRSIFVRFLRFCLSFKNRIFFEYFVRTSSCSNIKHFEVRGSAVFIWKLCSTLKASDRGIRRGLSSPAAGYLAFKTLCRPAPHYHDDSPALPVHTSRTI
jgi:hypothetical protein